MALPLFPQNKITEGKQYIYRMLKRMPETLWFMNYLYGLPERTNNVVESFHRYLMWMFGKPHSNIWAFTAKFQRVNHYKACDFLKSLDGVANDTECDDANMIENYQMPVPQHPNLPAPPLPTHLPTVGTTSSYLKPGLIKISVCHVTSPSGYTARTQTQPRSPLQVVEDELFLAPEPVLEIEIPFLPSEVEEEEPLQPPVLNVPEPFWPAMDLVAGQAVNSEWHVAGVDEE
ncbi:hypothetical protein CBL_08409 [Carabus blaptoides fortunei]